MIETSDELAQSIDDISSLSENLGKLIVLNYFAVSSDPGVAWAAIAMPVIMALGHFCGRASFTSQRRLTILRSWSVIWSVR